MLAVEQLAGGDKIEHTDSRPAQVGPTNYGTTPLQS